MSTPDKPSLTRRLLAFIDPLRLRAWSHSYREAPGWRGFGVRQVEVFVLTARSLHREEITLRAAALTYHTLLSIVPLMAVGFALFKAFGGLKKFEGPLRELIVENLAVGRADEVGVWLDTFIQNINAGAIAGFGVLILFYSAVGLLTNIEHSINHIWGIRRSRSFFIRFAIYWCLITLAPPLLAFSVSFSAKLQSSSAATTLIQTLPFGLGNGLVALATTLSICVAFILTYLIVPATRVRLKAAILGGLVAGVIWSLTKYIFISIIAGTQSAKYSAIYGALGALPLLMIWIYLSWVITLFGATFAFANQSVKAQSLAFTDFRLSQAFRELLSLRLCIGVAADFRAGKCPTTLDTLVQQTNGMLVHVERCLEVLLDHKILLESYTDGEVGYVPGQDLQEQTPAHILKILRQRQGAAAPLTEDTALISLRELLEQAENASDKILSQTSLRELTLTTEPQ